MKYTLRTAAEACGMSKTAIHNAIKSGRLSSPKNDKGEYEIEPSELHRVFAPVHTEQALTDKDSLENAYLKRENELLKDQVAREREQADHWRRQATMLLELQPEPETPVKSLLWLKLFGK